jgi:hypothetical protein
MEGVVELGAIGWHWLSLILALSMVGSSSCHTPEEYVRCELVVNFKSGVSPQQVESVAREVEAEVRHQIEGTNIYLFVFPREDKAQAAIDILKEKAIVESVFQNIVFKVSVW